MKQLGELQKRAAEIRALDAEIIAIASRGRQDATNLREALDIDFALVPGPKPKIFRDYGVFNSKNGLAVPATMIIDKTGVVRWKYVSQRDDDRPSVDTILKELRKLQ